MKKTLFCATLCSMALLVASCGLVSKNYTQDAAGIEMLGEDLKDKFGTDAWYTDLGLGYSDGVPVVSATETDDPASLKMREWGWTSRIGWRQISDVTLKIEDGVPAETFMFQLGGEVDMKFVGELVEKSKEKLTVEKNIAKPRIKLVDVSTRDGGDISIFITLEPENGGTAFRFFYNLAGELVRFDY